MDWNCLCNGRTDDNSWRYANGLQWNLFSIFSVIFLDTHAGTPGSVCLLERIFIPISQVTVDKLNSLSISLSFDCFIISFHFVDV